MGCGTINRSQGFWGAADRMTLSLNALRSLTAAEEQTPGRKLVLWVSPGWPLLSGPEIDLDEPEQTSVSQRDCVLDGDAQGGYYAVQHQ